MLWLTPPQLFSNQTFEPQTQVAEGGILAGQQQTLNYIHQSPVAPGANGYQRDNAWYVLPIRGVITGYTVNQIIPYNLGIDPIATVQELPIAVGVARWNGGNGEYDIHLTGSFVTRGGGVGAQPEGGYEMFSQPAQNPPNNLDNESRRIEFSAGDLLIAGIGYGRSMNNNSETYPRSTNVNVTIFIEWYV